MSLDKGPAKILALLVLSTALAYPLFGFRAAAVERQAAPQASSRIEFITAEQLKAHIASSEPVAVIDVRSTTGLGTDERKVKGAIHVKLRRLKSRLRYAPLKDVPQDRLVVTYCACPSDESSIRAAEVLLDAGFKRVRVLKGGWVTWKKVNGQMETLSRGD